MSDSQGDGKLELKQASKDVKESENVAEKYSAMTVTKNSEMGIGDIAGVPAAFTPVAGHKPVKKVSAMRCCVFCGREVLS